MKIPPKHQLASKIDVQRVSHGCDVIIRFRWLPDAGDQGSFDLDDAPYLLAWFDLTSVLRDSGFDIQRMLDDMPEPEHRETI